MAVTSGLIRQNERAADTCEHGYEHSICEEVLRDLRTTSFVTTKSAPYMLYHCHKYTCLYSGVFNNAM
jgi:hypothetical protein